MITVIGGVRHDVSVTLNLNDSINNSKRNLSEILNAVLNQTR